MTRKRQEHLEKEQKRYNLRRLRSDMSSLVRRRGWLRRRVDLRWLLQPGGRDRARRLVGAFERCVLVLVVHGLRVPRCRPRGWDPHVP